MLFLSPIVARYHVDDLKVKRYAHKPHTKSFKFNFPHFLDQCRLPPVLPAPRQDPSAQRPSARALKHPASQPHYCSDPR